MDDDHKEYEMICLCMYSHEEPINTTRGCFLAAIQYPLRRTQFG